MFMGLKLKTRKPITEILKQTPQIPAPANGLFLRNHDELTLEMVSTMERDYMYDQYAATNTCGSTSASAAACSLLDNDRRRIEL